MNKISKILIGIESSLITSATILSIIIIEKIPLITKVVWIKLTEETQQILGLTEPYLKVTQTEGLIIHPYQTIGFSLFTIAGIIGFGYFSYMKLKGKIKLVKWKTFKIGKTIITINKPIKKKKHLSYIDRLLKKTGY